MIHELAFDILFVTDQNQEIRLDNWTKNSTLGYTYYEAALDTLHFSILAHKDHTWYLKVHNTGKTPVTGFAGIRFPWRYDSDCFTLIPGIYYDGNYQQQLAHIPHIHLPETPVFAASLSAATYPTVLVKDGSQGWHYEISPTSLAGWNGVTLDAANSTMTIYVPAKEEDYYTHQGTSGFDRAPHAWQPNETVCIRFSKTAFACETVSDLLDYHWDKAIRSERYPAANTPKISEEQGAALVRDWFYRKHCVYTDKKEPLILNAFVDIENDWPHAGMAEWNIMIGWCCGAMAALPLLKYGGQYRDFAVTFLDFVSLHGNTKSGVKAPIYDGRSWMTKEHPEYHFRYQHCRFYSDHLYYLGRAIRHEKENGHIHPLWEEDFAGGIAILKDIWMREQDFGLYWNTDEEKVTLLSRGTAAGAFSLLALAEGCRHFPQDQKLADCFRQACASYHEKYVLTGRSGGGPVDILEADDSESIAALTDALVQQHQLFGGSDTLQMALNAAKLFATWTVNYQPAFPGGSMLEGINVCGGVLANVQNRHVGPGICTNSARFVYDLGQITGDQRWTDLYWRIKAAAINCLSSYDGEFFGIRFDQIFTQGMISEQINMTNCLNPAGETWRASTSWPSCSILLGWYDTPKNSKDVLNL